MKITYIQYNIIYNSSCYYEILHVEMICTDSDWQMGTWKDSLKRTMGTDRQGFYDRLKSHGAL